MFLGDLRRDGDLIRRKRASSKIGDVGLEPRWHICKAVNAFIIVVK